MKKKSFTLLVVAAICGSMMFTSCIGSYSLSNRLLSWNKTVGGKFVNELVFILLWCGPYEITAFLDTFIFNAVEFWTGSNPMADAGTVKTIETENGIYTVETKTDGYHIEKEGEEATLDFKFDEQNQTWSVSSNGEETKLMQYKDADEVVMFLPDGRTMDVELNAEGLTAFREVVEGYSYYAAR